MISLEYEIICRVLNSFRNEPSALIIIICLASSRLQIKRNVRILENDIICISAYNYTTNSVREVDIYFKFNHSILISISDIKHSIFIIIPLYLFQVLTVLFIFSHNKNGFLLCKNSIPNDGFYLQVFRRAHGTILFLQDIKHSNAFNHMLSPKLKLVGNCKFNYLTNILIFLLTCGAQIPLQQMRPNTYNI